MAVVVAAYRTLVVAAAGQTKRLISALVVPFAMALVEQGPQMLADHHDAFSVYDHATNLELCRTLHWLPGSPSWIRPPIPWFDLHVRENPTFFCALSNATKRVDFSNCVDRRWRKSQRKKKHFFLRSVFSLASAIPTQISSYLLRRHPLGTDWERGEEEENNKRIQYYLFFVSANTRKSAWGWQEVCLSIRAEMTVHVEPWKFSGQRPSLFKRWFQEEHCAIENYFISHHKHNNAISTVLNTEVVSFYEIVILAITVDTQHQSLASQKLITYVSPITVGKVWLRVWPYKAHGEL